MAFDALPWESGALAFVMGEAEDPFGIQFDVLRGAHVALPPLPEGLPLAAASAKPPSVPAAVQVAGQRQPRGRRMEGKRPATAARDEAEIAIDKWALLLATAGQHSSLGKLAKGEANFLRTAVAQCLEAKSPGTSAKRAGALLLFVDWARKSEQAPFPINEEIVNQYLAVAVGAAPTRAGSFLEALAFAYGLFGLCDLREVLSARNKGLAVRGAKRKRKRVQRIPITAAGVQICEAELALGLDGTHLTEQEFILLGFFTFRVHTRLRCGDASRITSEPVIVDTFVEAELEPDQHKTGHAKAFRNLSLPVAGFAQGILDVPWCACWLEAREVLNLNAMDDGTLQPAAYEDGTFGDGRMTTSEIGQWERAVLRKLGLEEAESTRFGTHSAKATLLSWAAKADLTPHHRRLLGAHVDKDEQSMLTYARDAMAGPLEKLGLVLQAIRERRFNPDPDLLSSRYY